jgi:hypothetical protein
MSKKPLEAIEDSNSNLNPRMLENKQCKPPTIYE